MLTTWLQGRQNKQIAEDQHAANQELLRQQLDYDRPINQRARLVEGGYSPALAYGQGSPGNQGQPLKYPEVKPTDFSQMLQSVDMINRSKLTESQVQATNSKVAKDTADIQIKKVQKQVLERNPLLNEAGFSAIIDSLIGTADLKTSQGEISRVQADFMTGRDMPQSPGVEKMFKELELLESKFNLSKADEAIRAQVLKSQEFNNEILRIQKEFMTNGEITPEHIRSFIMMLLMKLIPQNK